MARRRNQRGLSLLMQAYAFIGLSLIVMLLLSNHRMPTLDERSLDAPLSLFNSLTSVTGAAVDDQQEQETNPETEPINTDSETDAEKTIPEEKEQKLLVSFEQDEPLSRTTVASSREVAVGTVTVENPGKEVSNVKLAVSAPSGEVMPSEVLFEDIPAGEEREGTLRLLFTDAAVSNGGEEIILKGTLGFADANNFLHEQQTAFFLAVKPHRTVEDAPKGYARFVPQDDSVLKRFVGDHLGGVRARDSLESQRLSARWIYESIHKMNLTIVDEQEGVVRFPAETLAEREGSRADLAVLFAGLLHHADFDAALVLKDGVLMAAYIDTRGYIVPVVADAPDYETALTEGIEVVTGGDYKVVQLDEAWKDYPPAQFPSASLEVGEWPKITRQIGRCNLESVDTGLSRAKVPVRLSNTGEAYGIGCVGLVSYEYDQRSGEKFLCYTVRPRQVIETELSTLVVGSGVSCEEI